MNATLLTALQLQALRAEKPLLVVLDVRLEEDYQCCHIAGAMNNCVYEMAFQERLAGLLPDKSTPVCVYGESSASHEAAVAAEKLLRAGYDQVYRLQEGLAGWRTAGLSLEESHESLSAAPLPNGRLSLNLEESRVEWLGRNLLNKHWGRLPLKSGHLDFTKGVLCGGEMVLSMTQITCDDLAGTPVHDLLIAHLCSDDFFDTERYPEARLVITSAEILSPAGLGAQNLMIRANLTLRGVQVPVEFMASAGMDDQGHCAAQASFSIDRTQWGIIYGSGKFFHRLAGHLVNDLIDIQVRMVTA